MYILHKIIEVSSNLLYFYDFSEAFSSLGASSDLYLSRLLVLDGLLGMIQSTIAEFCTCPLAFYLDILFYVVS